MEKYTKKPKQLVEKRVGAECRVWERRCDVKHAMRNSLGLCMLRLRGAAPFSCGVSCKSCLTKRLRDSLRMPQLQAGKATCTSLLCSHIVAVLYAPDAGGDAGCLC